MTPYSREYRKAAAEAHRNTAIVFDTVSSAPVSMSESTIRHAIAKARSELDKIESWLNTAIVASSADDEFGDIRARSNVESLLNDVRKQAVDRIVTQAQARFRDSTGKGFTVTCNNCSGKNVHLYNDLDYHPGDGEWGSVTLKCWDCDDEIELLDSIYDRR